MTVPVPYDSGFFADLALKGAQHAAPPAVITTARSPERQQGDVLGGPYGWVREPTAEDDDQSSGQGQFTVEPAGSTCIFLVSDMVSSTFEGATVKLGSVLSGDDVVVMWSKPRVISMEPSVAPDERLGADDQDPWAVLTNRVDAYRSLEPEWDGYEGQAPNSEAISDGLYFLALLPRDIPPPTPGVAGDGEVGFHWRLESFYVEVSFYGDGKIIYHARRGDDVVCADDERFNRTSLPRKFLEQVARLQGGG